MNKNITLIKNMTSQQESTIVGMDIYSPVVTIPYKNPIKLNKTKKST